MNDTYRGYGNAAGTMDMSVDAGLRSFMLGVYNKMGLGLILSAALAYAVGTVAPLTQLVLGTPLLYVVQFGPIVLLLGSMFFMRRPSPMGSAVLYWSIVTLIGMGLSVWVFIAQNSMEVTSASGTAINVSFTTIGQAFFITASAFLGLSLWGYTTKRNLSGIGSFLFMAAWGAIAISLLNVFFFQSQGIELLIQIVFLGLMAGIVAWQTQTLKASYYAYQGDTRSLAVMTNMGALNLYLAFVNIFQIILSLLGRE
ncbi:Bax inhibitor-1/YccA family protein [Hyphobacterium sp. HN65]|uniref:Bax inhibitor-1/YccA family protein n=1 Tax=Hyphobacterium lacteum TaxID=3116575 RepID=A0ABU7LTR7_9PROT|nr:Bax inhibitor-1/YccA family protein [Hyphobacterium sp. HN65]MEE2526739.1 Bax inhibitor-1/YccA family protein [Hyphobacterium sp. HN65]